MNPSHPAPALERAIAPSDRIMAAAAALFAVSKRLASPVEIQRRERLVVAEDPSGAPMAVEVDAERETVRFDDGMVVVLAGEPRFGSDRVEFRSQARSLPLSVHRRLGKFVVSIWGDKVVFTVRSRRVAELALIRPSPPGPEGDAQLLAPLPGLLLELTAAEGMKVDRDRPVAVLEAMKMENWLTLPCDAVVTQVLASPGELVAAAAPILCYRPLGSCDDVAG